MAREWVNASHDASFLCNGGRLELAESWVATSHFGLTATSVASLRRVASGRSGSGSVARRRRVILAVLGAAVVAASVMAAVAVIQRNRAGVRNSCRSSAPRDAGLGGRRV